MGAQENVVVPADRNSLAIQRQVRAFLDPRYIVYDTAEHLVPAVLAILRAESLWEVPVIGRMLGAAERRIHGEHEEPVSIDSGVVGSNGTNGANGSNGVNGSAGSAGSAG